MQLLTSADKRQALAVDADALLRELDSVSVTLEATQHTVRQRAALQRSIHFAEADRAAAAREVEKHRSSWMAWLQARQAERHADLDEAAQRYTQHAVAMQRERRGEDAAHALACAGRCFVRAGRFQRAQLALDQCLSMVALLPAAAKPTEAEALLLMGESYMVRSAWQRASSTGTAHQVLMLPLLQMLFQYREALRFASQARRLYTELCDARGEAAALQLAAGIAERQGETHHARGLKQQAATMLTETESAICGGAAALERLEASLVGLSAEMGRTYMLESVTEAVPAMRNRRRSVLDAIEHTVRSASHLFALAALVLGSSRRPLLPARPPPAQDAELQLLQRDISNLDGKINVAAMELDQARSLRAAQAAGGRAGAEGTAGSTPDRRPTRKTAEERQWFQQMTEMKEQRGIAEHELRKREIRLVCGGARMLSAMLARSAGPEPDCGRSHRYCHCCIHARSHQCRRRACLASAQSA